MNKVLKKAAEILQFSNKNEVGAPPFFHEYEGIFYTLDGAGIRHEFDPFYEGNDLSRECIARRQIDAIEDWLSENHPFSWHQSSYGYEATQSHHQWRLERIRVALEQLGEQDE